jgi:CoA binding domain
MPVNPHEQAIRSTVNYRSVAELPMTPDLAVLSTPPDTIPGLIAELGARGCRAAVVVSAGFGEADRVAGKELQQRMLKRRLRAYAHLRRELHCSGVSPGILLLASSISVTATRISARVLRSGASSKACFSAGP